MSFGPKYQAATVRGYAQLQARLHAMSSPQILHGLQTQAIREQRMLLYTTAIHRKTGHTGQLITPGPVSATNATIYAKGLAVLAETGTRPHEITPKVARVLAWGGARRLTGALRKGAKADHFAMRVHHPGTKAHEYLLAGAKMAIKGAGLLDRLVGQWNNAA